MNEKHPINRGMLFAGSYVGILLAANNATFSIISRGLSQTKGWELNDLTFAYPLNLLVLCIVGIFAGIYSDQKGTRKLMFCGGILGTLGWVLTGWSVNPVMFYCSFGILCGVAEGFLYTPVLTQTLKWFPEKRGVMSGVLLSAAALGPFIMSPIFQKGGSVLGFPITMTAFGCCFLIVGIVFSRYQPGFAEMQQTESKNTEVGATDLHPREMIHTLAFYVILLLLMALSCGGNMMTGTLYTIAIEQVHMPAAQAAWMVSLSTLANLVGRLSYGRINDKIGAYKSLTLSILCTVGALLLLCTGAAGKTMVFCACIAVIGFSFAGPLVIFPSVTQQFFGSHYFGVNYGIVFLGYSIAAFIGPRIALSLFSHTGSFVSAYRISALIAIAGGGLLFLLKQIKKP